MARKITGAVVEHTGRDGRTYRSLRFTGYGKRRFESLGPVSRGEAEAELRHVLADLERGVWRPREDAKPPAEPEPMPSFHAYAERWWGLNVGQLAPRTQADYRWRLERHLLPFFAELPLDEVDIDVVERYMAGKVAEDQPLSPRSINMTLTLLSAILESAVERDLISRNPAQGRRRRVREHAPRRTYLDTSAQVSALLSAAGELDDSRTQPAGLHVHRRAMLATFLFAGLRIGELCSLRWRDVDLAAGWLHVGESKTDAGRRRIKIRGALRDELVTVRAQLGDVAPDAYVFATSTGRKPGKENIRNRVLAPAVELASASLVERGYAPLPALTPHSLRRTFASLLYALGEDPATVMSEMGHTNPHLALAVYAQVMGRDPGEKAKLAALVDGDQMADEMAFGEVEAQKAG